jgi:hypothetical protein
MNPQRYPVAFLSSIVYCEQPMPVDLAETIRILRRDRNLEYEDVMWTLCEGSLGRGQAGSFGQALTELACATLNDCDPAWK